MTKLSMAAVDDSLVIVMSSEEQKLPEGAKDYGYETVSPEAEDSSDSGPSVTPLTPQSLDNAATPEELADALLASPKGDYVSYEKGNAMFEDADLSVELQREVVVPENLPHVPHEPKPKSGIEEAMAVEEARLQKEVMNTRKRIRKHQEDVEKTPKKIQKGDDVVSIPYEDGSHTSQMRISMKGMWPLIQLPWQPFQKTSLTKLMIDSRQSPLAQTWLRKHLRPISH